ncbi:hypothetical protein Tco_0921018 [Tanacetum coccineum]
MTDIGSDIFHTKVKEFAKFLKDKKTTSGHVVAGDDLYFFNDVCDVDHNGISGLETTWFPHTTDCVILLAVCSGFKSGRKLLSWRRFDGDCRDSDDCANLPGRITDIQEKDKKKAKSKQFQAQSRKGQCQKSAK